MKQKIMLRGTDFWIDEEIAWIGKDGEAHDTEAGALTSFGYDADKGCADWAEVTVLGDKQRKFVLTDFSADPLQPFVPVGA